MLVLVSRKLERMLLFSSLIFLCITGEFYVFWWVPTEVPKFQNIWLGAQDSRGSSALSSQVSLSTCLRLKIITLLHHSFILPQNLDISSLPRMPRIYIHRPWNWDFHLVYLFITCLDIYCSILLTSIWENICRKA